MFVSAIIPTIGRDTLARTVESVLAQDFPSQEVEVIIVNDSAQPLAVAAWQADERVQLVETARRERSVARNTGAAVARGRYLFFLDDDDWLLPDALKEMWALAQRVPGAAWLYGGIQVVDTAGKVLAELNSALEGNHSAQVMGGAWVPIQSSFIRSADFFAVGGFNPFILGTEDQDLCRRITLHGSLANTPAPIACLFRGDTWQTSTNYSRAAEDTRISRDAVLSQPGAFGHLLSSADSAYWHGRVVRAYLSTVNYNLRQRSLSKAISRSLYGTAALLLAGRHLLSRSFWQAVRAEHVPDTLHFVMADLQKQERNRAP